uniref:C2H2-type domain-containing protein n=1 Tax=Anabas testudineus TaxID=64144 RepID=A0A7N6ACP5_ANATE
MKSRNLRHHILTHNEVKPYRCKACDSCFSRYDHLKVHQTRCRGRKTRLEVCIPKISLDDVGRGWQSKYGTEPAKKEETFECEVCLKRFPTQSKLSQHVTVFHSAKLFNCASCGSSFAHERSLKKHKKLNRCRSISNEADASTPQETNPPTENLAKPLNVLKSRILQRITPCFNKKYKYVCSYCPRAFGNSWQLGVHTRLHTGEKPYACEYCGQRFIRKDYVQLNKSPQNSEAALVQSSSSKEKKAVQYQCSECDKSFTDGLLLISHLEDHGRQEQEKKRNTCSKCGRVCASHGHLENHMKIHGIEKKYPCPDCSKMVYSSSDLEIHRTCHDPNRPFKDLGNTVQERGSTEQQPSSLHSTMGESDEDENNGSEDSDSDSAPYFPCHVCGKTFPTSESLEDHQRCHLGEKPHECEECGKCFFQASQLQQHQRMHQSEFQCQACGRGFMSLFALRKHKHTHGKSRPYRCSKCHLSFTGPSQLAEHMFTHREENFPFQTGHFIWIFSMV